jgi:hypothetical protein
MALGNRHFFSKAFWRTSSVRKKREFAMQAKKPPVARLSVKPAKNGVARSSEPSKKGERYQLPPDCDPALW